MTEKITIPKIPLRHVRFLLDTIGTYWHANYLKQPPTLESKLAETISNDIVSDLEKIWKKQSKKSTIKLPYYKALVLAEALVHTNFTRDAHLAETYKLILLPKLI